MRFLACAELFSLSLKHSFLAGTLKVLKLVRSWQIRKGNPSGRPLYFDAVNSDGLIFLCFHRKSWLFTKPKGREVKPWAHFSSHQSFGPLKYTKSVWSRHTKWSRRRQSERHNRYDRSSTAQVYFVFSAGISPIQTKPDGGETETWGSFSRRWNSTNSGISPSVDRTST